MDFEPIIIVFVVVWAISALARKAKTVQGAQSTGAAAKKSEQPKQAHQKKQPQQSPQVMRPTAYQPIQSRMVELSREGEYVGSLGEDSTEGIDPCHDDEMARAYAMEAPDSGQTSPLGGVAGMMNRDSLVRAVVMSEILTRPSQRKRGL